MRRYAAWYPNAGLRHFRHVARTVISLRRCWPGAMMRLTRMQTVKSKLPTLGFVGLGVMGSHMATHLSEAGYPMILHDLDMAAARGVASGLSQVQVEPQLAELARRSDIIITMLPDGHVVHDVVTGESGLAEGVRPGSLLLDTSSAEPWLTQKTAAVLSPLGVVMVDAPVSGAQIGAKAAELVFMVGGRKVDVARIRPLLEIMGRAVYHLGELGAGHA